LTDRVLDHILVLLQFLEYRGFLQPQANEDGNNDQDKAGKERHPPEPRLESILIRQLQQCESSGAQERAELNAHEWQRREVPATLRRSHF